MLNMPVSKAETTEKNLFINYILYGRDEFYHEFEHETFLNINNDVLLVF